MNPLRESEAWDVVGGWSIVRLPIPPWPPLPIPVDGEGPILSW